MVTNANLNYFKQQGFTAVVMVVPDSQTYQTQLTTIKSLNMLPIIDIEMPIWDGGQLESTNISNFSKLFPITQNRRMAIRRLGRRQARRPRVHGALLQGLCELQL